MSYYIATYNGGFRESSVYRVVKRLSDFRAEDGQKYRVFPSRKAMKTAWFIDLYIGKDGKLKKLKDESLLRFSGP